MDEKTRELLEAARDEITRLREGLGWLGRVSVGSKTTRPEAAHWFTEETADLRWDAVSEYTEQLLEGMSVEGAREHVRRHMLDELDETPIASVLDRLSATLEE